MTQRVWITKYALTKGVFEVTAEICADSKNQKIKVGSKYYYRSEWQMTEVSARIQVDRMITKRIVSLDRQKEKLLQIANHLHLDRQLPICKAPSIG